MSMSMRVIGLAASSERHEKMLAVVKACAAVDVEPPADVLAYFAATIDEYGEVGGEWAGEHELQRQVPSRDWRRDMSEGIEVDVADIPPDVTTIRFYCS